MAENSAIEWTDHTFNPWEGCQKVGPGCDHCYAETRNARYNGGTAPNWGPGAPRRRTSASNWAKPLKWQGDAERFHAENGRSQRVFCASLADVFDNAVDWRWRLDLFGLIKDTPDLDWLLLTKRIGNVPGMLDDLQVHGSLADVFPNVWLGATIVNQEEAGRDIPKLLAVPAAVRFLSMEPLRGPVELNRLEFGPEWLDALSGYAFQKEDEDRIFDTGDGIDWVIVGGESGPGARPMHPDWARSLRDQCAAAGVPFLFKQWGEWRPDLPSDSVTFDTAKGRAQRTPAFIIKRDGTVHCFLPSDEQNAPVMLKVGKKRAGRLLDGVEHNGFPA